MDPGMADTFRSSSVLTSTRTYGFVRWSSRISAMRASAVISGTDGTENSSTIRSISAARLASSEDPAFIRVGLLVCRPREVDRRLKPRWGLNPTGTVDRRT